uniref:Uncharacterized protein n=1 Tax=Cryptomonas curvata TaxID=233186 RepID=A0A7S0MIA7_9CRYP|mmetsp:Transcript_3888/g.8603  ORF Transcript_3888/g.8603 Transcript_3888/m.8603 type:complete len:165 (+) Transcript_3888:2-496(+)
MGCGSSSFPVERKANTTKNTGQEFRSIDILDGKKYNDDTLSACVVSHATSFNTSIGILKQSDRTTKLKELLNHSDAATDTLRLSRAAIAIQRIVRGKSARGSMSQRRNSSLAEIKFLESIDPYLSPAENASKSLLDLARRLNLSLEDITIVNYAIRTLQVGVRA